MRMAERFIKRMTLSQQCVLIPLATKIADSVNEIYVFRNEVEIERMDTVGGQGNLTSKMLSRLLRLQSLTGRLVSSPRGCNLNLVGVSTPTK